MRVNYKARMFNRKASSPKSRPDEVMKALGLRPGQTVADIGAGGGYFSFRFAEAVGEEGRVGAFEVDRKLVEFIEVDRKLRGLTNLKPVLIREGIPEIKEGSIDLVFVRNVYHHLTQRVEYFKGLRGALKPGGKLAIIEYSGSKGLSFHDLFGHYVRRETIIEEMGSAGYRVLAELDILSEQSFTIFGVTGYHSA